MESQLGKYSIKDLEQITGIKAHTLRIWEKRYHIVSPSRTDSNIRFYNDSDLKKLLNISILNRHGFKISNLAKLCEESLSEKIISLSSIAVDYESQIEGFVLAMIEMDEGKFEKLLNNLIMNLGFEDTFLRVIQPFFEKVGILWQVGTITPSQEHFISNLIRQKLIVAIDGIPFHTENKSPKTFILYLPENELHELGLLFYSYLIQKRGHKVIYLGQSVPFDDLSKVVSIHDANALLTTITTHPFNCDFETYLEKLSLSFADLQIFVGGYLINNSPTLLHLPPNIMAVKSFNDFKLELDLW